MGVEIKNVKSKLLRGHWMKWKVTWIKYLVKAKNKKERVASPFYTVTYVLGSNIGNISFKKTIIKKTMIEPIT